LIPAARVLPVLSGGLRGARWVCGSSTHGCWLGIYESGTQQLLKRLLRPDGVFYDIGANVGFFTLLASRLVGSGGRVLAFEPLPRNIHFLKRHIEMNSAANVTIVENALGDHNGTACFDSSRGPSAASISDVGDQVQVRTLDSLCASSGIPGPTVLKIDVEGFEMPVLKGAEATIKRYRPSIVLSAHGWKNRDDCLHLLEGWGYHVEVFHAVEREGDYGMMALPISSR